MPSHQLLRTSQLGLRALKSLPKSQQFAQLRFKHGNVSTMKSNRAPAEWGAQWKRIGGCAAMYFPIVGVVMFWPYVLMPVMEYAQK